MPFSSHKTLSRRAAIVMAAMLLVAAPAVAAPPPQGPVNSQQVVQAVQRGLGYLRARQGPDGGWPEWTGQFHGGTTALALLAMLTAGVEPTDPAVVSGLAYLDNTPNTNTYSVSLKCQVYSLLGPAYRRKLAECTAWLVSRQAEEGIWNYGYETYLSNGDYSNTQLALLGLHMAQIGGINVPAEIWTRSRKQFASDQQVDGGWNYKPGDPKAEGTGSMTAAAVASLYIAQQHLAEKSAGHAFIDGRYPDCGKFDESDSLRGGLAWLAKYFTPQDNVGGANRWLYYYLYGIERVGMISGLRFLGRHDWYREGCQFLVSAQGPEGSWGAVDTTQDIVDTAFCVLFLAKGNRPVVVQKIQWDGRWNRNIHDLENLTNFMGDKLGARVTWQNTPLSAPLSGLLESPLMVITGHEFPQFDEEQRQKIRQFIEGGGTLLAEACCGSKEFATGFRQFAGELFPQATLRPLPLDHPVFHTYYDMAQTYNLEGLGGGCRTSVFFSPRALSALWQLQEIPHFSELAMQLGTNLVSYALSGRPIDQLTKLDPGAPPEIRKHEIPPDAPPGAVQIATLMHPGDFNPDPHAIANLALLIKQTVNLDVVPLSPIIKPEDPQLSAYPVVFMTGHFDFELTPQQLDGLRGYLQRGGVLVAEPCCGAGQFDQAFRRMTQQLFPDLKLEPLKADHPIYTGKVGIRLGRLTYRKMLADELGSPTTDQPPLEAVVRGGGVVILYSPYDFSCALEGDNPPACRGYIDADGQRLALAVFLFALAF